MECADSVFMSSSEQKREKKMRVDGLFGGCGSNASADELAEYFRCQGRGTAAGGGEPKIQYGGGNGVRRSGGLSFVVVTDVEKGDGVC